MLWKLAAKVWSLTPALAKEYPSQQLRNILISLSLTECSSCLAFWQHVWHMTCTKFIGKKYKRFCITILKWHWISAKTRVLYKLLCVTWVATISPMVTMAGCNPIHTLLRGSHTEHNRTYSSANMNRSVPCICLKICYEMFPNVIAKTFSSILKNKVIMKIHHDPQLSIMILTCAF